VTLVKVTVPHLSEGRDETGSDTTRVVWHRTRLDDEHKRRLDKDVEGDDRGLFQIA
jgi:hypothetical protein